MKSGSAICRGAEPGDGTTIKVYLPRCFGEERIQEQAKEPDTVKSTNWRCKSARSSTADRAGFGK